MGGCSGPVSTYDVNTSQWISPRCKRWSSPATTMLSDVLGRTITCDVRHPKDVEALFNAGSREIEDWYARSSIEFCTQLSDGRLGYIGTVRDDVPYLLAIDENSTSGTA